ncbi:MAG: FecR domain-containing protein [Pseudomonadota bacterium]
MNARSPSSDDQIRREAHEWRDLKARAALTGAQAESFDAWLAADLRHERAYDRAVTVWAAVDHLSADDIDADLLRPPSPDRQRVLSGRLADWLRTRTGQWSAATLCLIAALPVFVGSFSDETDRARGMAPPEPVIQRYTTDTGEIRTITLPDGTTATLGAATAFTYVAGGQAREARLEQGDVFLEVVSDQARPFTVAANDLISTVVGTAFEVRSNGGVTRVAVAEGEVAVSFPLTIGGRRIDQRERVRLTAALQVSADSTNGLSAVQPIPKANIGAWRDRRLIYDGATLTELVADIQRYSDLDIEIDPALDLGALGTISASFNSRDIATMTETLPDLFPISMDRTDAGQLTISR